MLTESRFMQDGKFIKYRYDHKIPIVTPELPGIDDGEELTDEELDEQTIDALHFVRNTLDPTKKGGELIVDREKEELFFQVLELFDEMIADFGGEIHARVGNLSLHGHISMSLPIFTLEGEHKDRFAKMINKINGLNVAAIINDNDEEDVEVTVDILHIIKYRTD
ncbi:MAG: hypothetical protein Q4B96_05110 [Bacillota bacterium]|nr:hypothetical protein [Bacillota bacterium]